MTNGTTIREPVILCVDDEALVLRSLQRQLHETLDQAYLVEMAQGGADALAMFEELAQDGHEIPLVIADYLMPDMKGDELLIRIHQMAPRTMKIMLTGQAHLDAVIHALNDADLYRYIAKPWESTDMILTVKEALRRYFQDRQIAEQNITLQAMNVHLEQLVQQRTAALEAKSLELEEKNRQLQALNASKDTFFSIIAHDLKNPFTTLLGYTDFIAENLMTTPLEELKDDMSNMQQAAKKLYALLNNLLTWSRIQRGVMPYKPSTFSLRHLAEESSTLFAAQAAQKNIRFNTVIPEELQVYADYHMINTVLRNLLSNALKFTPDGGQITLSAQSANNLVEVLVADTGVGIAEKELPRLFRIDGHFTTSGVRGEEGTGLGLILSKDLVEKNGGTLWLTTRSGGGTTFTFTLPPAGTDVETNG